MKATKRVTRMHEHFLDALVHGYEPLLPAMTNQEKDRHVLAAAVAAGAEIIVTRNLRDFPRQGPRAVPSESQASRSFPY